MKRAIKIKLTCIISVMLLFLFNAAFTQEKDTSSIHGIKNSNIFKLVMNAVSRSSNSGDSTVVKAIRNENQFLPFEGKVIRNIIVKRFGFEKQFTDTTHRSTYFGTRLLNHLHRDSREWVIRDNLFFKEKSELDPHKLADNERFLRTLNFIQDARIEVTQVPGSPDSVDVEVITKDLFSISGQVNGASNTNFNVQASESNFLGFGQQIAGSTLFETDRYPAFGYSLSYTKTSIGNLFVNASAGYSTMNPNLNDGLDDEKGWYARIERPLVSEYMHFAGGLFVGSRESFNAYSQVDSQFYKYAYTTFDAWAGYALGGYQYSAKSSLRNRTFLSIRYLQNNFSLIPYQVGNQFNFRFNDREAVLGQLTMFKQDYFKTNYIYGFGTTEDVPHGYNISFTTGWYRQANLHRPYAGFEIDRYIASSQSDFVQYFLRTGAFLHNNQVQDASVLAGTSIFSRLFLVGNIKLRQYFSFIYTRLFNNVAIDPLKIDNPFGLRYFSSDSTIGEQRITFHAETFMFLKYKLLGFKFAPFVFTDGTLLTPPQQNFLKSEAYYGIGGGVRTRNENFVFGTIEIRGIYFPRQVPGNNTFKILTTVNLQFRYNTSYVHEPDIVQLNSDPTNTIYTIY